MRCTEQTPDSAALLVFTLAFAAAGCASTTRSTPQPADTEASAVMDADLRFAADTQARRLEGWVAPFADDGAQYGPAKGWVTGKDDVRQERGLGAAGLAFEQGARGVLGLGQAPFQQLLVVVLRCARRSGDRLSGAAEWALETASTPPGRYSSIAPQPRQATWVIEPRRRWPRPEARPAPEA